MVFNSLLLWTLATVSVEWARHRELSWRGYLQAAKMVLANPVVAGILLGTGWGLIGFPLPGMGDALFNAGLGKDDLTKLINQYNQTYTGKPGPNPSQKFPTIAIPQNYDFGRNFNLVQPLVI